ncbi:MAG: hypothetical protein ACP5M0_05480, partial [Desulfomonilaceae bacterium]
MLLNPISRSHLITPFGVGALSIAKDGSTMITAALDYWFHPEAVADKGSKLNPEEYKIDEWRLQKILRTDYFLLPPDYRQPHSFQADPTNLRLTVPAFKFPRWHTCPRCGALFEFPLTLRSRQRCKVCEKKGIKRFLVQVEVVAVCDYGHIRDFPWREWVHGDATTSCREQMTLYSSTGSTLQSQIVKCACGARRALAGITQGNETWSFLSEKLNKNGEPFLCDGQRPWLGPRSENTFCGRPLRGALKGASNVYFPEVLSAIYLPRKSEKVPSDLVELLESPLFSPLKALLQIEDSTAAIEPHEVRSWQSLALRPYSDEQIRSAIEIVAKGLANSLSSVPYDVQPSQDAGEDLRRLEYEQFSTEQDEAQLHVTLANLKEYDATIMRFFSKLALVKKLRETRVLVGFSRIYPESPLPPSERKYLLRKKRPPKGKDWLPATLVHGEGLFLQFNEELLRDWENQPSVV